jgi:hypothetical protein
VKYPNTEGVSDEIKNKPSNRIPSVLLHHVQYVIRSLITVLQIAPHHPKWYEQYKDHLVKN